jgi:hypothetical protein
MCSLTWGLLDIPEAYQSFHASERDYEIMDYLVHFATFGFHPGGGFKVKAEVVIDKVHSSRIGNRVMVYILVCSEMEYDRFSISNDKKYCIDGIYEVSTFRFVGMVYNFLEHWGV